MTLKKAKHPFQFVTQVSLIRLTGRKARDLSELAAYLKTASPSVVYYHTHHFLKQHEYLSPEPTNDFAYWVTDVLQEARLGEKLAAIDTVRFTSIRELANKIVTVIETYLAQTRVIRPAPEGEEFHFMKSQSFFLPTAYKAQDLQEFVEAVKRVSISSLYHHMFEARIRLEKETNDFSNWLKNELGESELAGILARLDPYTQTLEGLRTNIVRICEKRLRTTEKEVARAS